MCLLCGVTVILHCSCLSSFIIQCLLLCALQCFTLSICLTVGLLSNVWFVPCSLELSGELDFVKAVMCFFIMK